MTNSKAPLVARACCTAPDAPSRVLAVAGEAPMHWYTGPEMGPAEPFVIDRPLAWHEAGHALAMVATGGAVEAVTLVAAHPHARGTYPDREARAVGALAGPLADGLSRGWLLPENEADILDSFRRVRSCQFGTCDQCQCMLASMPIGDLDNVDEAIRRYRRAEKIAMAMVDSEPGRRYLRLAAHELLKHGEVQGEFFHDLAKQVLPVDFLNTLELETI